MDVVADFLIMFVITIVICFAGFALVSVIAGEAFAGFLLCLVFSALTAADFVQFNKGEK